MNVNDLNDFKDFAEALQIINGFCNYIGNCELCPFYVKIRGEADNCCFFIYPNCDGKTPGEWDIKTLFESDDNDNGR